MSSQMDSCRITLSLSFSLLSLLYKLVPILDKHVNQSVCQVKGITKPDLSVESEITYTVRINNISVQLIVGDKTKENFTFKSFSNTSLESRLQENNHYRKLDIVQMNGQKVIVIIIINQ